MIFFVITVALVGYASAQTGLCPQQTGDFPNPNSEQCTTFFRCVQGQPNLLRCPVNQRFDFLFRICRPQEQVNCNNQLQLYAAPTITNGIGGVGGAPGALGGLGGLAGLGGLGGAGALGGALGGGLGAGLPQGRLINLLLNRGGGGDGGNRFALVAALSQMVNQRRAPAPANARRAAAQPQPQQPPFNQVIPLSRNNNNAGIPIPNSRQLFPPVGFQQPRATGAQPVGGSGNIFIIPGNQGVQSALDALNRPGNQVNPVNQNQLQQLVDLAAAVQGTQAAANRNNGNTNSQ